jgi:hypothetical protein
MTAVLRRPNRAAVLWLGFLLLAAAMLPAQEAGERTAPPDYRVEPDGRIVQTLSWSRSNAFFYEVELQLRSDAGSWVPHTTERTEALFIEVSLPPGMYRYRILSYNVLGRQAAASPWTGIRIYPARAALVDAVSPSVFYIDSHEDSFTLTLSGSDLMDEARVYLLAPDARRIEPRSVTPGENDSSLAAVFPAEGLVLGSYALVVINPGGLETTIADGFTVSFSRPVDLSAAGGYGPLLPLYGNLFTEYDALVYPLGAYGRFTVMPYQRLWGSIGGELSCRSGDLLTEDERFTLSGQVVSVELHAVYRKWFFDYRGALNLRIGCGAVSVLNMRFEHQDGPESGEETAVYVAVSGGASWQWYLREKFFLEGGVEYVQLMAGSGAGGYIRASAGAGWRF